MSRLQAEHKLPTTKSINSASSPHLYHPFAQRQPSPPLPFPTDIDNPLDIEAVLDEASRYLSSSSPSVDARTSSPSAFALAILEPTPPSSIAASSPARRRVSFFDTPSKESWSDGAVVQPLPSSKQRNKLLPKPILKQRSPPVLGDPEVKMSEALKVLATNNVDNHITQYNGLEDVLRMVDDCPQEINALLTTSKKELLQFVARDMVVKNETTQLKVNLARNVVQFLPLLVNRPGFGNGAEKECAKILNRSLDFLENTTLTEQLCSLDKAVLSEKERQPEKSGKSEKVIEKARKAQAIQLSNLTRLHFEFWIHQTLTKSLDESHVRRMSSVLEKHWKDAENARKAREKDPKRTGESPYEKAHSVQARLNVLQKLLYQVPAFMTKNAKRWLLRLLEETICSKYADVRKTATDIGIATAYDMGRRKEVAEAMLSIMTNPSKSKDRTYVQRRIVSLNKRLNADDNDKDLVPDTWVFPLLYMRHPEVKPQAWKQLATYRDVIQNCFEVKGKSMKLACWEALRKLISSEFEDVYNKQRFEDFWQWIENWVPGCFEKVKQDSDFKSPVFLSAVYTYLRVLQKAIPAAQQAGDEHLDQVWETCVVGVMNRLIEKGTTRTHRTLACQILAALFGTSRSVDLDGIWMEHQDFGAGLRDIQPVHAIWIRTRLPQIKDVILPFLEYDFTNGDGRKENDELRTASTAMWIALLQAASNSENNMDFTSSGRKELKKFMANITNLLSSLWTCVVSASDLAIPPYFYILFTAVDTLGAVNFAQNHISLNGSSFEASTPTQKGQKASSACSHLTALIVKSLFSKPRLCENRTMQSSLSKLWSLCLISRNTRTEKLDYLRSLSETVHDVIRTEWKANAGCKQANLVFTPILKLATDTFLTSVVAAQTSTFDRQSYDHTQRIIRISLSFMTPEWIQFHALYSAMVSSTKSEALALSKTNATNSAPVVDAGDVAVAIVLTVPHARIVLRHFNDARPPGTQPAQRFLLNYVNMIVKHDDRIKSRVEFKRGRELFESANKRLVPQTIDQHYSDLYKIIDTAILTLYSHGSEDFKSGYELMLVEFVATMVDHIKRTPATKQSILTFNQKGISSLIRDVWSKVFTKKALGEKIDELWKVAGERMTVETAIDNGARLKEHDILIAAGISSPRFSISTCTRDLWHTHFAQANLTPFPEVVRALQQPQFADRGLISAHPLVHGSSGVDPSESHTAGKALPDEAQGSKHVVGKTAVAVGNAVQSPIVEAQIPSSPPISPTSHDQSQMKHTSWSLFQNDIPEDISSTPIMVSANEEDNVPSSPIVSSERRRTNTPRNPRAQERVNNSRKLIGSENIPSSHPVYTSSKKLQLEDTAQRSTEDTVDSTTPTFDDLQRSTTSDDNQLTKGRRGCPRKVDKQDTLTEDKQSAYMNACDWRERFHNHRPHISSLFQDHDRDLKNRVWMEKAEDRHIEAAKHCKTILKLFGRAPFDVWASDRAPNHWDADLLKSLAKLACEIKNGVSASELASQVDEARGKRLENESQNSAAFTSVTKDDIDEVIEALETSRLKTTQPLDKRKREKEPEASSSHSHRKRNRTTPSQSQGSQELTSAGRYPKRNRETPYKPPLCTANLKINKEKTPKARNWKGWVVCQSESPEPDATSEDEDVQQVGVKKRPLTKSEIENVATPASKRRKLDPPSTPDRDEVRSDPVVNITPGNAAGRANNDVATPASAKRSKFRVPGSQSKASPTAWLQRFKELLMDVPTYIWRPRDQQEVAATYSQVWERVLDNTGSEE